VPYVLLAIGCLFFASQNNIKVVLSILPYLVYSEMYMRTYVQVIPYLFLPYLFIAVFGLLFTQGGNSIKIHSKSFGFLFLFTIIEVLNSYRARDENIARFLVMNSIALFIIVMWSSYNIILPSVVNRFLNNIKYASIYLCGIVLARYMMGDVDFSGVSSSEAINGLAPVQISGYLGFSGAVFFLSVMNNTKGINLILNLALLCLNTLIMLLSFSRGGIYFLGVIMILYFFFNRTQLKSYLLFLLLIPATVLTYYYVSEQTNGKIAERYEQEGASGRKDLVVAGLRLFVSQPLVGVGTGNYNDEVKKANLYSHEAGAHDEFVRAIAEHGLFGIITYWGFYISLFFEILARKKIHREYALYFLIFFCMITVHNGLKISLQPLLLMLAVATPMATGIRRKKNVRVRTNEAISN
jgi:O-antigen ligase